MKMTVDIKDKASEYHFPSKILTLTLPEVINK